MQLVLQKKKKKKEKQKDKSYSGVAVESFMPISQVLLVSLLQIILITKNKTQYQTSMLSLDLISM